MRIDSLAELPGRIAAFIAAGSLLEGWRLGGLADDVVSCVSELVANVYEHVAKPATAELFVSWVPGRSLTIEVRDQDSRLPRRHRIAELGVLPFGLIDADAVDWRIMQLAEAGRGLALVDALCDRLTWQPNTGGGKVVRCHWRLKAATDTARSNPQPSGHSEGASGRHPGSGRPSPAPDAGPWGFPGPSSRHCKSTWPSSSAPSPAR